MFTKAERLTSLRNLRKFNFMRVLNQVGIAQLPEFGMATAQQGFTTLVQEIPHLKTLLVLLQILILFPLVESLMLVA